VVFSIEAPVLQHWGFAIFEPKKVAASIDSISNLLTINGILESSFSNVQW
jgi:hypothetical protein